MNSQAAVDAAVRVDGFRQPEQRRSRATLERFVEATGALLIERGSAGVTVKSVVKRANASVGSFYARFEDKNAAIQYVQARYWAELESEWDRYLDPEQWTDIGSTAVVACVIRDLVRHQFRYAPRLRAFMLDALTRGDAGLVERMAALDEHVAWRMAELLEARRGDGPWEASRAVAASGFLRVLSALRDDILVGRIPGPAPLHAARERALVLGRMYAGLLGVRDMPERYGGFLRLCSAAHRRRREFIG